MLNQFSFRVNKLKKTVYLRPPKEANTNKIWSLQKYVYGLADASRYWYLHVKKLM